MKKETYESPAIEILSLELMKETLQGGSANAGGTGPDIDVTLMDGDDFNDIFNIGLPL